MAFKMFITKEDQSILQHVEDYGFITISQCQNMFYNTQKKGYEMARKHLAKLVAYNRISLTKRSDKNIYHIGKVPNDHKIFIMDYYTQLINCKANILHFKLEQSWLNGKYFSDAFCCYTIGSKVFFDILEVVLTSNVDANKYIEIYNSGEPNKLSAEIYSKINGDKRNIYPRLIIVDDIVHKKQVFVNDNVKVLILDLKLDDMIKLFL